MQIALFKNAFVSFHSSVRLRNVVAYVNYPLVLIMEQQSDCGSQSIITHSPVAHSDG